jgi:xanthine/uracil/vitamin C permease (AzgA family)
MWESASTLKPLGGCVAASVPPYAIGPALITVGALMMINVVKIRWEAAAEALPAFLTIVIMPLTYSIAYGEAPSLSIIVRFTQ